MKKLLALFTLFSILFGSCRKESDIGPAEFLYQRWHLDRTKKVGDEAWIMYDTDGYYDTEYRPDGTLVYRKDGIIKSISCCEAGRFERSGNTIQYSDFIACPFSLCATIPQSTTITILKENLFELQNGNWITQYTPAK